MSVAEALEAARAAGVMVTLDEKGLLFTAATAPPTAVIDLLRRHKAEIVDALRADPLGWTADDWKVHFDKRAAIAEHDGGLPRGEVEARARQACIAEWMNRHSVSSAPGRCLHCGGAEREGAPILPFGIGKPGHAWLHAGCWSAWHAARKEQALAALEAMGVDLGGR